jgi:hypothetical protein
VADRNGDSAVFAPSADGEWNYTMRENSFQVVTNFNLAIYPEYTGDSRYNSATGMLSAMGTNLTLEYFTEILEEVHNPGGYSGIETIYSNVYDLVNGEMYLFYRHDFSQYVRFNITEELEQGYHRYHIQSLFGTSTSTTSTTTTTTTSSTTSTTTSTETPDYTLPLLGVSIGAGAFVGVIALALVKKRI